VRRGALLRLAVYPACFLGLVLGVGACSHGSADSSTSSAAPATSTGEAQSKPEPAPPPEQTGGFDGAAAYDYTAKLVSFGPRPPGSDAIHKTQDYILGQLKSFGCPVDVDDFHASTPVGELMMKNIIVKIPGTGRGIILLMTHYDTVRIPDFVGANDAGSSTGLMMEVARVLCAKKEPGPDAVWIAFVDGEEAQQVVNGVAQWSDSDSLFGSRELAASMELSGDLKRIKAVLLADMVGAKDLNIRQDPGSTGWLNNLVWKVAARLGYASVFIASSNGGVEDDHTAFLRHDVPAADITEFPNYTYWHTTQDTMDKLSPKSLAISGHVFLESVKELQATHH